jgi:hypothetical protein
MTDLILKYLRTKDEAKISGFGTFRQKEVPAFYNERSAAILPPGKELFFVEDFNLKDENFIQFVAKQRNRTINESYTEITELVNYWKFTLQNKIELDFPELGTFYTDDDHFIFKGRRFSAENPNNFGLEEVNIGKLINNATDIKSVLANDYKKSHNKIWWLLFILPTIAIVYFASQNPELIFGKKSFQNLNKPTLAIKKQRFIKDTIKADSLSTKNSPDAKK